MRKIKNFMLFMLLVISGVAIGTGLGIVIGNNIGIGTTRTAASQVPPPQYIEWGDYAYTHVHLPDTTAIFSPYSPSEGILFDPDNPPPVYHLDYFFSSFGEDIALFFKNIETGFTYIHNPDRVFFGASLSKLNHALYIYKLAERGLIDMYALHTFTAADHWGGTGILRFKPAGAQLTTRELLGHSIVHSCNAAFRMLVRYTALIYPSFGSFLQEIGANGSLTRDIISQNTTARDMGLWMYAVHYYLNSDSRYGHYFLYDLHNTAPTSHPYFTRWEGSFGVGYEVDVRLLQSDYPMARKYGWSINAFHDAAIIYGPSPFILVVLSNMDRGAHELFEEISWLMQGFNGEWFV